MFFGNKINSNSTAILARNENQNKKPSTRKSEGSLNERINGEALAILTQQKHVLKVGTQEKLETFGKIRGLHSSYDTTPRYDIEFNVIEHLFRVETVTDFDTGKSIRASTLDLGPPQTQMTWGALNKMAQMTLSFGIPYHRFSAMMGVLAMNKFLIVYRV